MESAVLSMKDLDKMLERVGPGQFESVCRRIGRQMAGRSIGPPDPPPVPTEPNHPPLKGTAAICRDLDKFPRLDRADEYRMGKRREALLCCEAVSARYGHERQERHELEARWIEWTAWSILPSVYSFQNKGVDNEDLFQAGTFGLFDAIKRFDWRRDIRFLTYSDQWFRMHARREMQNQRSAVRVPPWVQKLAYAVGQAEAGNRAMPKKGNVDVAKKYLEGELSPRSLDWEDEDGVSAGSMVPSNTPEPSELIEQERRREVVSRALERFHPKFRRVLTMLWGLDGDDPMDPAEVSKAIKMPRNQVEILQRDALKILARDPDLLTLLDLS